jgi:hypothetical protein
VSIARTRYPLLLTLMLAAAARAEQPLYVIEQLVVNVNSAPDASGERIATLKSGDRVELIERAGDQVHVRLANGRDGWVRASYLSSDEPLRVRLAQRDSEVAQLKDEVSRLQGELRAPSATGVAVTPAGAASPPAGSGPGQHPTPPRAEEAPPAAGGMFSDPADGHPQPVWPWTLAGALLGLGVGFAAGLLVLDRHIRRKYGGLRIY